MYIDDFAGYAAVLIGLVLCVGILLKAYYHFKFFKAANNLNISFIYFYINPFSYFFTKLIVYFPFILTKSVNSNDKDLQNYKKYVVTLSWVNLISCFILAAIVLTKN